MSCRSSRQDCRRFRCVPLLLAALLLFPPGCGSDSNGVTNPNGNGSDPAIALSVSPTSGAVEAGSTLSISATVTRSGGFQGGVTVEVLGLPGGVSASVSGGGSGTTANFGIELEAAASAAAGSHELTVRATGSGVDAVTRPFALTVTESDGGGEPAQVILDFSGCRAVDQPIWLGFRDGSAAWEQVAGPGPLWTFEITADEVAFAWVSDDELIQTLVTHLTREELLADQPMRACVPPRDEAVMTGSVSGVGATEFALVAMGPGAGSASGSAPQLQVTQLTEGVVDLVATRINPLVGMIPNRILIRRDVEVVDGGNLGTLDFEGSEAFDPDFATVSMAGASGGTTSLLMGYHSGAQCLGTNVSLGMAPGATSAQLPGVPEARQRDGDFHQYTAVEAGNGITRLATRFHRALASRTLDLPPLITPTVSELGGPGRRVSVQVPIPPDFRSAESGMLMVQVIGEGRSISSATTLARIPGNTGTAAIDDLSGAPGWSTDWSVPAGGTSQWVVQLAASNTDGGAPGDFCVEGAWSMVSSRTEPD